MVSHAKTQSRKVAKAMTENEIARLIVDSAYKVHTSSGPGLLESVYEAVLCYELRKRGLTVARQVTVPLISEGLQLEQAFLEIWL